MHNLTHNRKFFGRVFVSALAFSLVLSFFANFSYAQIEVDLCNPPRNIFQSLADILTKDIRYTVSNFFSAFVMDIPMTLLTGHETSQIMGCTVRLADTISEQPGAGDDAGGVNGGAFIDILQSTNCDRTDETTCDNVLNQYAFNPDGSYDRRKFASGSTAGSILGLAYFAQNSLNYEPLPVNTAYFINDYTKRLPVVGERALAADLTAGGPDYRHSLVNAALNAWKIVRNAAYSFMALIMLYVGITIILKKQVNQKMVVTVQYSLPKIFMALILIALSYPIGALLTSLSWSMWHSAKTIVLSLATSSGVSPVLLALIGMGEAGLGMIIIFLLLLGVGVPGIGLSLFLTVVIVVVIIGVLFLLMMFKAVMLYLKMIVGIITAPIEFAMGAIPGNEDKTMAWFKRMAAYGLGIAGMAFTQWLVYIFGFSVVIGLFEVFFTAGGDNAAAFTGVLFALFGAPLVFIFGFSYALKIPGDIENAIVGKPRR